MCSDDTHRGKGETLEHQEEPQIDVARSVARCLVSGNDPDQVQGPSDDHDEDAGQEEGEFGRDVYATEHRNGSARFPAYISLSFYSRPGVHITDESALAAFAASIYYARSACGPHGSPRRTGRARHRRERRHREGLGPRVRDGGADVAVQFNRGREAAQAVVEKVPGLSPKA